MTAITFSDAPFFSVPSAVEDVLALLYTFTLSAVTTAGIALLISGVAVGSGVAVTSGAAVASAPSRVRYAALI